MHDDLKNSGVLLKQNSLSTVTRCESDLGRSYILTATRVADFCIRRDCRTEPGADMLIAWLVDTNIDKPPGQCVEVYENWICADNY